MKKLFLIFILTMFGFAARGGEGASAPNDATKRVFFIGDSMTGWLAERLGAYGQANDFDVVTIVWDGSTMQKWGTNAARLKHWVDQVQPDAVFISLGMNDLWYGNYEAKLGKYYHDIVNAVGNRPLIWVGPPSWPGKYEGKAMTEWLRSSLNDKSGVFDTYNLDIPRQSSTNPHPTRNGANLIVDKMAQWLTANKLLFDTLDTPKAGATYRGPHFLYLRMKDPL